MKNLRKLITKFVEWLQPEHIFIFVDELPEIINHKTIYIVGNSKQSWLLALNCPCGCQNLIQLNLLEEATPCWKFKVAKNKKITISPSVWRTTGCKSHFFIRKSKIDWMSSSRKFRSKALDERTTRKLF